MFRYDTLSTDDGEVQIQGLKDEQGNIDKQFVWIEFKDIMTKEYPDQTLVWDYSPYIFKELYEFLQRYVKRELLEGDKKEFEEIYEYLDEDRAQEILELIEEAKKLNWDE